MHQIYTGYVHVPLDQEYFCVHDNDNLKNVLAKPLRFWEEEEKKNGEIKTIETVSQWRW